QHGPNGGEPVAAAREGSAARALEVQVAAVRELAEQERASIAQPWRESAELVARVGLRDRRRALGDTVADQHEEPLRTAQSVGVESELGGQLLVERDQVRLVGARGLPRHGQLGELVCVAAPE